MKRSPPSTLPNLPEMVKENVPVKQRRLHGNNSNKGDIGNLEISPYFTSDDQNINDAWDSKNYRRVLVLLKKDKSFPKRFLIDDLNDDDNDDQKCLREFVETRNRFHEFIKQGDLDEVKKMVSHVEKSKLYLNTSNESACYVAIKHERYDIYAYLESIEIKFKSAKEKKILDSFNKAVQFYLRCEKEQYFHQKKKGHIDYLVSKSHSKTKGQEKYLENVREYYEELDKVPEISIILKVLQYSEFLKIIFDFEGEDIKNLMPTNQKLSGNTRYKEGKVYIAASKKRGKANILGTMAHELGHMAMDIVYDNDCNPYYSNNSEEEMELEKIVENIRKGMKENYFEGVPTETLLTLLHDDYVENNEENNEAIVRVPEILIQHRCEGRSWLQSFAEDLFQFYSDKVVPDFKKFIENSPFKKSADANKELNKTFFEVNKIMEVHFEKFSNSFKEALKFDKNVLLLYTENTSLTLVRVLQGLYGENFKDFSSEYALFRLESLSVQKMYNIFSSEPAKMCIIEYSTCPEIKKITRIVNAIEDLLNKRPNLKFIFIGYKNEETVKSFLGEGFLGTKFTEGNDLDFSLNDLDDESKDDLLCKEVTFQGKEIILKELIGRGEELLATKKIDIISKLCGNEKIEIGSRVIGTSSLEGAYADVIQEIDIGNFKDKLERLDDVFVIEGIIQLSKSKKEEIMNHLGITAEYLSGHCEEYRKGNIASKRILLADFDLTEDDFKKFCRDQEKPKITPGTSTWSQERPDRIYWIKLNKKGLKNPKFILKQCYYPNFYLKRKFREKIIVKSKMNELPKSNKNPEFFLIGCKDSDKKSLNVFTNPHVKVLSIEDAQVQFNDLNERNKAAHLFKVEKGEVIWQNSSGSVINIKKCLSQKINNKFLINEKDFIKEIFDKKVVLISDDPGMGKTTTVTKLYEEQCGPSAIIDARWLIRINLKDHLKAIRNIKRESFDIEKIVHFLCDVDQSLNNDLCRDLLNSALDKHKNFDKPLLIVFDGFDELSDENSRQKILSLLGFLKKGTKCKLWVTTRRHYKDELEETLATLAMEFNPVKDEEMRKFIKKYLHHRISLVLDKITNCLIFGQNETIRKNSRMWNYTKSFIEKMRFIFKKDAAKFIGVPLQLCLMLEDAVGHFKEFASNTRQPDFSFFGDEPNLLNIYEKFIDMKYFVYFRKKNLEENFVKKSVKKFGGDYCKSLAESLTLNNDFKSFDEEDNVNMLSIGVIKRQNENLEFIHFTFREYFSSQVFIEYIKDERLKKRNFNLAEILVKEIFLQPDYQLMRTFINLHLEKINVQELPKNILKEIGEMVALLWGKKPCLSVNEGTVLHLALEENNMNIYNLIFLGCEKVFTDEIYSQFLQMKNKRQQLLFHIAVSKEKGTEIAKLLNIVLERLKPQLGLELLAMEDKNGTALNLAERKKNDKIVELLTLSRVRLELKDD